MNALHHGQVQSKLPQWYDVIHETGKCPINRAKPWGRGCIAYCIVDSTTENQVPSTNMDVLRASGCQNALSASCQKNAGQCGYNAC